MLAKVCSSTSFPVPAAPELPTTGLSLLAPVLSRPEGHLLSAVKALAFNATAENLRPWHAGERRSFCSAASNVSNHTSSSLHKLTPEQRPQHCSWVSTAALVEMLLNLSLHSYTACMLQCGNDCPALQWTTCCAPTLACHLRGGPSRRPATTQTPTCSSTSRIFLPTQPVFRLHMHPRALFGTTAMLALPWPPWPSGDC